MHIDVAWLSRAIDFVKKGEAEKITKEGITVYKAGDIVRVDIKP